MKKPFIALEIEIRTLPTSGKKAKNFIPLRFKCLCVVVGRYSRHEPVRLTCGRRAWSKLKANRQNESPRHSIASRAGPGASCKEDGQSYESGGSVMNWIRVALTVLAGGIVASLTDWLFMGDWLYKRYNQYPEIWRHPHGQGEMKAIAWSAPLPFVTCAVFTLLCARLNFHSYSATVKLALAIWLVGPLPLLITNALFIKLHSAITASYSLGWLVKLVVAAVAVTLILR